MFSDKNIVMLNGIAEGTFIEDKKLKPQNHWKVPAAWRAVIKDNQADIRQLYVNPDVMFKIYNSINKSSA